MTARSTLSKLSKDVYLGAPALSGSAARSDTTRGPECVLLLGWMDAQLVHLQKYVQAYNQLYPDATILVLRLGQRSFYRSSSHLHRTYEPAVAYLRARFPSATSGPTSPLLVHTFSNGGCTTLKAVDELLQASATDVEQEREPLVTKGARGGVPARAIVFDSCPGRTSTLRTTLAAFTAPFKTWWTRWPATVLISALYALLKLKESITRRPSTLTLLSSYLTTALPTVPRLYLFSKADHLIPSADVLEHAAAARHQGVDVTVEEFEGTMHVAHVRKEPERYWGAVKSLWEASGREQAAQSSGGVQ